MESLEDLEFISCKVDKATLDSYAHLITMVIMYRVGNSLQGKVVSATVHDNALGPHLTQ